MPSMTNKELLHDAQQLTELVEEHDSCRHSKRM